MKTLNSACPRDSCCGRCSNAVTRPIAAVSGSAGLGAGARATAGDSTPHRSDASLVRKFEAGLLKTLDLYRELVGLEIGRASEYGARWWSRRLVEVSEEAGLVRLDQ